MKACWLDGKMVDPEIPHISIFDHGLLYGDGVFEGIRFYEAKAFRLDAHLRRLERSAKALSLTMPYTRTELVAAVLQVIEATCEPNGYIRLVITRGKGDLGVDPRSCKLSTTFILADGLEIVNSAVRERGARLLVASTRRLGVDQIDPRIKSLNYLNQILARIEANNFACDEAVMLNRDGFVAEGSADNLFIASDGALFTPPLTDGALDGITRRVVIDIAKELGISCHEQSLALYDLYNADECFLTGTGAELIPVAEVQGRKIGTGDRTLCEKMSRGFRDLIHRESAA